VNVCYICVGDISIEINAEAYSNDITECPQDDQPSTGMFAVSDVIFSAVSCLYIQWCRSQVKSGGGSEGINIEKIEGVGSGRGCALSSSVSGSLPPEKNQFCAKIMQL